jgi:hypothetical protein
LILIGVLGRHYAEEHGIRQNGTEAILQDAQEDGRLSTLETTMDEATSGDKVTEGTHRVDMGKYVVDELGRESADIARFSFVGHLTMSYVYHFGPRLCSYTVLRVITQK